MIKHSKKEVFVDLENSEKNEIEKEADEFSKDILISNENYNNFIKSNVYYDDKIIIDFAHKNNITTGVVVGRLQNDKIIKWNQFNELITRLQ